MMTLIAAAALAAAPPPSPAQAGPAMQQDMHMDGHMAGKDMDCCKHCCDGMDAHHEQRGAAGEAHSN